MTISEAIAQVDALKPNLYTQSDKIRWLSELDGRIFCELIATHEPSDGMPEAFSGYDADVPTDTPLLVPFPYEDVYLRHLERCIDYHNGEIAKYNNANALFAAAYTAFEHYWNRTRMPSGAAACFVY